uniref:Protein FAM47E n=1 Tax=Phallusia mammillata TaxID=59560 RepID=A0A6F9DBV5_9ASCI|nr:protein FAM47E [Phallusia mammillata]
MAQHKYDLLVVPNNSDKVIRQQPWYRERLRTKYIKRKNQGECLIGRNWTFVRPGADDFRDGLPPDMGGKFVVEGMKGISPVISHSKDSITSRLRKDKINRPVPSLTKSQACFSKRLPLQQKRSDHIEEVEFGLTQHPLALYPHLEEGMPPELFEEIVDLLDPAMNPDLESEEGSTYMDMDRKTTTDGSGARTNTAEEDILEENEEEEADENEQRYAEEGKQRNPYKWIHRKDEGQKDDKRGLKKRPTSPSQDEHIKKVTKEFCDWVSDLGGDSNNVEESTIVSLFASGYETKPALSVPIHVVELSNVPSELRISAGISPRGSARKSHPSSATPTNASRHTVPEYEPSWVKLKYGAWYLDPSSWKARPDNEPLEDPEEILKREMSESKKKSNEMDAQLAPLHGARAFRDFLERNERRKPEFMGKVAVMQDIEDAKNENNHPQKMNRLASRSTVRVRSGMTVRSAASTHGFR